MRRPSPVRKEGLILRKITSILFLICATFCLFVAVPAFAAMPTVIELTVPEPSELPDAWTMTVVTKEQRPDLDWTVPPEESTPVIGFGNDFNYDVYVGVRNVSADELQFQPVTIAKNGDILEFYFKQECEWYEYLKFEDCEPESPANITVKFTTPNTLRYVAGSTKVRGPGIYENAPWIIPTFEPGTVVGNLIPGKACELRFQAKVVDSYDGQFAVYTQYAGFKKLPNGNFRNSVDVNMAYNSNWKPGLPIAATGN